MCFSCIFCLFCACCFCPFSLPIGVGGWLRFAIAAFPGFVFLFTFLEFKKYVQFQFQP